MTELLRTRGLTRHFKVQQAHGLDIIKKLRGQLCQVHLVNIDFLLLNQVEEQIEGAFENLKFYVVFGHLKRATPAAPEEAMLGAAEWIGNV